MNTLLQEIEEVVFLYFKDYNIRSQKENILLWEEVSAVGRKIGLTNEISLLKTKYSLNNYDLIKQTLPLTILPNVQGYAGKVFSKKKKIKKAKNSPSGNVQNGHQTAKSKNRISRELKYQWQRERDWNTAPSDLHCDFTYSYLLCEYAVTFAFLTTMIKSEFPDRKIAIDAFVLKDEFNCLRPYLGKKAAVQTYSVENRKLIYTAMR